MIWFKLKSLNHKRATIYTSNHELAAQFDMVQKRKGKFYFRVVSSKFLLKALGIKTPNRKSNYMKMIWQYPEASQYVARKEKIPLDIKTKMEQEMGWNPETKTFKGCDV
jgi:hypothetical protein